MAENAPATFRWLPGRGPDPSALERMRRTFPKPKQPMGEAWFMSCERRMYPRLMGRIEDLDEAEITKVLEEIASGPGCFGQRQEWTEWYHHLLPRLMMRPWRASISHPVELLITGFMAQHPQPSQSQYPEFCADAVATLGRYIMSPDLWPHGVLDVRTCLSKWRGPNGTTGWHECGGLLSASLFFCLKYLPADAIRPWFHSVLDISDPRWKAQILVWMVGAHPILTDGVSQPAEFSTNEPFSLSWSYSHGLSGNWSAHLDPPTAPSAFLPSENKLAVLQVARRVEADELFETLRTDPTLEQVAAETAGLEARFAELYQGEG